MKPSRRIRPPGWRQRLAHPNPKVRARAIAESIPGAPTIPPDALLLALQDPSLEVRTQAARALAARKIKAAVDPLLLVVRRASPPPGYSNPEWRAYRETVIQNLAAFKDRRIAPVLLQDLCQSDPDYLSEATINTLAACATPNVIGKLVQLIDQPAPCQDRALLVLSEICLRHRGWRLPALVRDIEFLDKLGQIPHVPADFRWVTRDPIPAFRDDTNSIPVRASALMAMRDRKTPAVTQALSHFLLDGRPPLPPYFRSERVSASYLARSHRFSAFFAWDQLAALAVAILASLQGPRVVPVLTRVLRAHRSPILLGAIEAAILANASESVIAELAELLSAEDLATESRTTAIRILAGIHLPLSLSILVPLLSNEASRDAASDALVHWHQLGLLAQYASHGAVETRRHAVIALGSVLHGVDAGVEPPGPTPEHPAAHLAHRMLLGALADDDPHVREEAVLALLDRPWFRNFDFLAMALFDDTPVVRGAALEGAAHLARSLESAPPSDPARGEVHHLVDLLLQGLLDSDSGVRARAALGFLNLQYEQCVSPLVFALRDADPNVRAASARVLASAWTRDSRVWQPLVQALWDSQAMVRLWAANAMKTIGPQELGAPVVDRLIQLLDDEWTQVRAAAVEALGAIGDPRAINPLVALKRAYFVPVPSWDDEANYWAARDVEQLRDLADKALDVILASGHGQHQQQM